MISQPSYYVLLVSSCPAIVLRAGSEWIPALYTCYTVWSLLCRMKRFALSSGLSYYVLLVGSYPAVVLRAASDLIWP